MTHSVRATRMVSGIALVAAIAVGGSGCSSESDTAVTLSPSPTASPSPTPSPSPVDPAEAAAQARIADAEQRYREFLEIYERHERAGTNGYRELNNNGYLGGMDIRAEETSYWKQFVDLGLKQVGESAGLVGIENAEYTKGDPLAEDFNGHRITFEACLDTTGADIVKPDGSSALQDGVEQRVRMSVLMEGLPAQVWAVSEVNRAQEEC